jgi:hypothetical protein
MKRRAFTAVHVMPCDHEQKAFITYKHHGVSELLAMQLRVTDLDKRNLSSMGVLQITRTWADGVIRHAYQ